MSVQRRRGQKITAYPNKLVTDERGNEIVVVDLDNPIETTAAIIPQRSARAEVAGQQMIDIVRMIVRADIDLGLWGRVFWDNDFWDIAQPPAYHHGTRRTRHQSLDVRRRPN